MDRADLEQWGRRDVARLLALVEGQRRYFQEIVAALPVGVLVLSAELEIVLANNAVRRLLSLPEQGPVTVRLDILLPAWVRQRTEQVLKSGTADTNLLVEAEPGRLRLAIIPITGWESEGVREALIIMEHLVGPTQAAGGVPASAGSVPVQTGLSPKLSAQSIAEQVPAVFWAIDARNMRPLFVSPHAERVLGFGPAAFSSKPPVWMDRVHPADRGRVTEFYQRALRSRSESACEFRSLKADGQVTWLRETVRPVMSGSRPVYLAGITVDVSERRLLESQQVQAERADALQKLASRVSHDLNNMLMILQGNAEEVLHGLPAKSEVRPEMEALVDAARRISGLTSHLLAFSRRPPVPAESIDLESVLSAAADRLNFQRQGGLGVGRVRANAAALDQVLTTLVQAVRSQLPAGGVVIAETLTVEVREQLQADNAPLRSGEYIAITVAGADAKFRNDVGANRFEHILPEPEAGDDTGTQLAEAYALVRQWGGDIAAPGAESESPVFRIFLRAANGVADVATATGEATGAGQSVTILLVEDEAGIRSLVEKFLRKHGYEVLEASNGEEALATVHGRQGPIDLVVTDMIMPQMGGRELVDRLEQLGHKLKVLYISGYTDDASVYSGELPAGSDFLQKPFTLSALLDKVRQLLS